MDRGLSEPLAHFCRIAKATSAYTMIRKTVQTFWLNFRLQIQFTRADALGRLVCRHRQYPLFEPSSAQRDDRGSRSGRRCRERQRRRQLLDDRLPEAGPRLTEQPHRRIPGGLSRRRIQRQSASASSTVQTGRPSAPAR